MSAVKRSSSSSSSSPSLTTAKAACFKKNHAPGRSSGGCAAKSHNSNPTAAIAAALREADAAAVVRGTTTQADAAVLLRGTQQRLLFCRHPATPVSAPPISTPSKQLTAEEIAWAESCLVPDDSALWDCFTEDSESSSSSSDQVSIFQTCNLMKQLALDGFDKDDEAIAARLKQLALDESNNKDMSTINSSEK